MSRPFQIRFAGQAFFDLSQDGLILKKNEVILAGGKHMRMLYVPVPATETLTCMPLWPKASCIVIDRTGQEFVAINMANVDSVTVANISAAPLTANIPHVLDISRYRKGGFKGRPRLTRVRLQGGAIEEQTIAGKVTGTDVGGTAFPPTDLCSEVVWKAAPLAAGRDNYQLILRVDSKAYTVRLFPSQYEGADADPIVVFALALCGWKGQQAQRGGTPVDFDGPFHLFGRFKAPQLRMSAPQKHPRAGGCPPIGRRS